MTDRHEKSVLDKELSAKIRFINFIATCIIVFYHFGIIDGDNNSYLYQLIKMLAAMAMSFFFSVSGFLLFHNLTFKNYLIKIRKRIFSLLSPYFLWQIIFLVVQITKGQKVSPLNFFSSIFLLNGSLPDGALWYLYAIFILALFSPLLLFVFRYEWLCKIGIVVFVLVFEYLNYLNIQWVENIRNIGLFGNVFNYFTVYLLGCYYGYEYTKTGYIKLESCSCVILLLSLFFNIILPSFTASLFIKLIPFIILIKIHIPDFFVDRKVYHISFVLYALHQPLIYTFRSKLIRISKLICSDLTFESIFVRLIGFLAIFAFALIVYLLLSKLFPRAIWVLTGGRHKIRN